MIYREVIRHYAVLPEPDKETALQDWQAWENATIHRIASIEKLDLTVGNLRVWRTRGGGIPEYAQHRFEKESNGALQVSIDKRKNGRVSSVGENWLMGR